MKKIYIYNTFNRVWHWLQAALMFFLGFTGFEIHGSFEFFGFETAVRWHKIGAISLMVLIVFAIFWHFTTGAWRQYIPTMDNLIAQAKYYLFGIFKNEPHPTEKTELSKLNPLQRLTYVGLKTVLIPVLIITGLMYIFYEFPQTEAAEGFVTVNFKLIALIHTAGAFAMVSFVIVHMYLVTTGHRLSTNMIAMITGCEKTDIENYSDDISDEDCKKKNDVII
ncbi:MAG: cytochrome b/b6 domain-containing protein [Chlorobi bacterium]|nr:cytochrome b/b6 domain-containing protein [Chlorobiota bacterium]